MLLFSFLFYLSVFVWLADVWNDDGAENYPGNNQKEKLPETVIEYVYVFILRIVLYFSVIVSTVVYLHFVVVVDAVEVDYSPKYKKE